MDANGTSNTLNARAQPSIRSFFQPRQPSYTAPPGAIVSKSDNSLPTTSTSNLPPIAPKSTKSKPSKLPPQATISTFSESHIQPLRRINSLLLPINYPDAFYHKILSPDPPISFSRVITWTDPSNAETKVIGGVVCRLDPALAPESTPQIPVYIPGNYDIYIQSLALLSPYRRKGLAAAVLDEVVESAITQTEYRIASLYAHVWTENEEALEWYSARGFKPEGPVLNGYYRRLKPDTAYIFRRRLTTIDHLQSAQSDLKQVQSVPTPPISQPATPPIANAVGQRPGAPPSARSFQEKGPEREWNDLPEDVLGNALLKPPSRLNSREGSATSSRSSSRSGTEKAKKKRVYPAAAFGGQN